jgi:SAM-dependent methyltransferase/aminoglycoside phosphotransferase (APT) family kinase protein
MASGSGFKCEGCDNEFPVNDGIIDLRTSRFDYSFNPVSHDKMANLIADMDKGPFHETIHKFLDGLKFNNFDSWIDNLVTDGRYAWKLFLDLNPDAQILDLGCGLGNLTHNLAPHVGKAYAMDLTVDRLQFASKRFELFNANDDVTVIAGGDSSFLPFPDDSLDLVVLSGVLEWVGEGDMTPYSEGSKGSRLLRMLTSPFGDNSPRNIQLKFLSEIRRILKKDGRLFVGIENRLNYEYLFDRADHHSGLRFGSLLPRFLANLYSIVKSHNAYRTYTYSIPGYKKLFAEAGFPSSEFLGLFKGYSELEEIVPVEIQCSHWKGTEPETLKEKIKRYKLFVPAYGIITGASPSQGSSLQDRILQGVNSTLSNTLGEGALSVDRYRISAKEKLLISGSFAAQDVMVRLPVNEAAQKSEEQNCRTLQFLNANDSVRGFVPRQLGTGEHNKLPYFIETYRPGVPLFDILKRNGRTSLLDKISGVLESLNTSDKASAPIPLENASYEALVQGPLDLLCQFIEDEDCQRAVGDYFQGKFHGLPVSLGLLHGDFGMRNILSDGGNITGLIDWENSTTEGLPVLDSINYLVSAQLAFGGIDSAQQIVQLLASGSWPEEAETKFLTDACQRWGFSPDMHKPLVFLNWLRNTAHQLRFSLAYNPYRIEAEIKPVLKSISEQSL